MSNPAQNQNLASRLADGWQVAPRTARGWVAKFGGAICSEESSLADRLLSAGRCLDHVRARASKILAGQASPVAVSEAGDPGDRSLRAFVEQQEGLLRGCIRRIELANGPTPDTLTITRESALAAKFSVNIGAARKQMAQLGIENGDLIGRVEVERLVRAWGARAALCLSRLRDQLAPALLDLSAEAQAAHVLEPALIIAGMLEPFARVERLAAGCGLPDWFLTALRTGVTDHVNPGTYTPLTEDTKK